MKQMNILVSLNSGYLKQLIIMLCSLLRYHPDCSFALYVMHKTLDDKDFFRLRRISPERLKVVSLEIPDDFLVGAPTSRRYPVEMYYRIFAQKLLPQSVDRILYLDPDLVVINPLYELYDIAFGKKLFAAASHLSENSGINRINTLRLSMPQGASYANSGVMMMNISALRLQQREQEVFDYINAHKLVLMLPDQDVLNAIYSDRIVIVDFLKYNLSERCFGLYNMNPEHWNKRLTLDWVCENTSIIHYCGRNKPWKNSYFGEFDKFYHEAEQHACKEGFI